MVSIARMAFFSFVVFLATVLLQYPAYAAELPIKVIFLSPGRLADNDFWTDYADFMQAAAMSLGIELTIKDGDNRFEVADNAADVFAAPDKPDYLVYIYHAAYGLHILEQAEKAGIMSFITNTEVMAGDRFKVGVPRGKFKHWIGHMFPDDRQASYLLTKRLLEQAERMRLTSSDNKVHVVAIGGGRDTSVSPAREAGLRDAVEEDGVVLDKYVLANWDDNLAYRKAELLMNKFPSASVYWAASDGISVQIRKAMKENGIVSGKDIVTGGIDWSPEGIQGVRDGSMTASVGGHFMEGAWVLVLIYDYHHGTDFVDLGTSFHSEMCLLDKNNMQQYLSAIDRENWKKIDFKQFTRTNNPMREYDFSPDAVVRELGRR